MDEESKPTRGRDNFESDGNQGSAKSRPESVISSKEYLTPTEAARLLGLSRSTVYRYLASNALRCAQFKGKTLIRRRDIDSLFDPPHDYQKRQEKERAPITEFYTTAEIAAKYNVSTGHIFNIAKTKNIPKVFSRGRNLWSKKHIDKYFAGRAPDEEITEWYSVRDIQKKFGMTTSAIYSFVCNLAIPKKKVKREVFYSKKHFDIAKGIARRETPQYYTVQEATEKYHITRDQLYHYVKRYSIPKQQKGRYVRISRKELDALFAPPVL
ncbi:MAG: helix-turn-helix domain-containing protein [Prevotella sp.]|nr:helix-turn-helix domain-containing protein [Prevotella sp.]